MKISSKLILMVFLMAGFALSGCTTAPTTPWPVYDEYGRPVGGTLPSRQPASDGQASAGQQPTTPPARTSTPSPTPADEVPATPAPPKPTPRIGSDTGAEPASESGHLVAAVTPLAAKARQQMKQGDLDRAFATAERAVRIDATNPDLWQLMAEIQLRRGNYAQAEQLAKKSNLLAKGNYELQAENWDIIADALHQRGETTGAEQAARKARELRNR